VARARPNRRTVSQTRPNADQHNTRLCPRTKYDALSRAATGRLMGDAWLDIGVCSKVYAAPMTRLTVARLAQQTGISADTIRYYDRAGLLPPAARSPAGYRQYDPAAAERLRFIKGAQRFGLRLREIAELLAVRDRGACPCGHAEALVRRRLAEVDAELARLAEVRAALAQLAADCAADACPDQDQDGAWPCEVQFIGAATRADIARRDDKETTTTTMTGSGKAGSGKEVTA